MRKMIGRTRTLRKNIIFLQAAGSGREFLLKTMAKSFDEFEKIFPKFRKGFEDFETTLVE